MGSGLLTNGRSFFHELSTDFVSNNCQRTAAALTFTTLFAVVPVFTVIAWMMSLIPQAQLVTTSLQDFLFRHFVPESSAEIQVYIVEFSRRALDLKLTSLIMLVVTSFVLLLTIESTINRIWQVAQPKIGFSRFLKYWGVLTVAPLLTMVGLLAAGYLWSLPLISQIEQSWGFAENLALWMPELAAISAFTVIFYIVPNTQVPLNNAIFGGVVTTALFLITKWIFGQFSGMISTGAIYGAFAALPFFLIWIYVIWLIVLAGSVFVKVLSRRRFSSIFVSEPKVIGCIRVLVKLREAHTEGRRLSKSELWSDVEGTTEYQDIIEKILVAEGLLERTSDDKWILGRDLQHITLWHLYNRFMEPITIESFNNIVSNDDQFRNIVDRFRDFTSYGFKCLNVNLDEILS